MEAKYYKKPINPKIVMSRRRSGYAHLFKLAYIVGELVIVNLSLIIAFFLVYDLDIPTFDISFSHYLSTMPFMTVATFVYIDYLGMTHFFRKNKTDMIMHSFKFVFLVIMTTAAIAFAFQWFTFPRWVMVVGSIFMFILTVFWSIFCLYLSKRIYSRGRLLIISTTKQEADKMYSKVRNELKTLHIKYVGYMLTTDIEQVLKAVNRSTEVMISSTVNEKDKSKIFLYGANLDKTIYVVPQFSDLIFTKFRVIQFHDMPTFMIDSLGLTFQQRIFKRTFDIVFSLVVLIITFVPQLVIALAIRLNSPGQSLYSQERITESGRIYNVYKFRTMVDGAEEKYGNFQSSLDDPRVTRIGRFLRETHMDELPQFFNILRGDMSVVGPRSDRPNTIEAFESDIPGYNQRLKVKSGLTGLAQIYGKYNSDPEDKLRFDMMYIKNYSFVLDLKVILQTLRAMLPNKNNYNTHDDDLENWEYKA